MEETVLVLGLDGMDIRYLEEAMKERELPAFERLKQEGVLGELTSCHPPTTIPAWPCMFTGKNPGKTGFFHYHELDRGTGRFNPVNLAELYGQYVWDTDMESALCFVPGISPPYNIQGRIVEGVPGPKDFRTTPPDLKDDIVGDEELAVFNSSFSSKLEKNMAYFSVRRAVVKRIHEKHVQDCLIAVYRPTDSVAHYGESMEEFYDVYEAMDAEVERFLDWADEEDATLLLVSDHGANHTEQAFFVNTWLHENGYLSYGNEKQEDNNRSGVLLRAANLLINLGLRKPLDRLHTFLEETFGVNLKPSKSSVSDQIEWGESTAVAYLIGALPTIGILLNEENIAESEKKHVENAIINRLEEKPFIDWAKPREELYTGEQVDRLPHIIVRAHDDTMMKAMIYPDTLIPFDKFGHGYAGVFGAYGPGVEEGIRQDAALTDIAPTLLYLLEKPIPRDMDGDLIEDIFTESCNPSYRGSINNPVDAEHINKDAAVKHRLEELGYLKE